MTEKIGPKPFVFVLMPFDKDFDDIYELGIKAACHEAGAYCERVDEQFFQGSILDRIYNQISTAEVIVSDMSGKNPNVFYETGYAHALEKQVILLTQKSEDIPFDLKHYPHIVYKGKITQLKEELGKRIDWCIKNPKKSLSSTDISVEVIGNGKNLAESPEIIGEDIGQTAYVIDFSIQLHNLGNMRIDPGACSIGLVLPKDVFQPNSREASKANLPRREVYSGGAIDDKKSVIEFHLSRPLLPDARETFNILLAKETGDWLEDASVIIYTEFGPKEYPFKIGCE